MLTKLPSKRQQLHRTQRAVKADGVGAESLNDSSHRRDAAAGKGAAVLLKGHGNEQRQLFAELLTGFFGGEDAGFDLVQIGHRFQHDEVGAGSDTGIHFLGKDVIGLLKGEGAGRFQQLSNRTDIQRNQCIGAAGCSLCILNGRGDDLLDGVGAACQLFAVGSKGVGVEDVGARLQVFAVYLGDDLRVSEVEGLGLDTQRQTALLQLGAHRSVQKPEAVGTLQTINQNIFHKRHPFFVIHSRCFEDRWRRGGQPH